MGRLTWPTSGRCPSCCRGPGDLVARVVEMARAERLKAWAAEGHRGRRARPGQDARSAPSFPTSFLASSA